MTTHELARELLANPNVPVFYLNGVEEDSPVSGVGFYPAISLFPHSERILESYGVKPETTIAKIQA